MKASELAEVTRKAIAKRNNERPAILLKEVLLRMKSEAERGESYANYAFGDPVEIVEEVIISLEQLGYHITKDQGPKKNLTKISWEKATKPEPTGCKFDIAWVGRCKKDADKTGFCTEHKKEKCGMCGKQATRQCDHTSQFVCGYPTCDTCHHHHGY